MLLLLQAFWQMVLLRNSPATLPYSPFLLGLALVLHLLVGIGGAFINLPAVEAVRYGVFATLLLAGFSVLLLTLYGLRSRLVQTMTAMAGCEVLIGLASVPLSIWLQNGDKANMGLPALLALLLVGWYVAVVAHIWRHALGVTKSLGFLFAIGYVILTFALSSQFQAPEG